MISNAQEKVNSKDFEYFFNRDIAPQLGALENERLMTLAQIKKLQITFIATIIIEVLVYLACKNLESLEISKLFFILIPVGLITMICLVLLLIKPKLFINKTKKQIFNSLFSYLGNFEYVNSLGYEGQDYGNIPLFEGTDDPPLIDDYIGGTYNNCPIKIEELTLDSGSGKSMYQIFKGLFVSIEQPQNIESTIIISNKNYKYKSKQLPKINTNDQEIDYYYNISGLNPNSDYNYLTPELFDKLKKLNEMKINAAICFHKNMIYIGIETNKNMFEIPFNEPITNIFIYKEAIKQLSEILSIVDYIQKNKE